MKRLLRIFALVLLLLVIVAASVCVSHKCLYFADSDVNHLHHITVLTYNTQALQFGKKVADNEVIRYLQLSDADVLCLQEVLVYKNNKYLTLPELKAAFPNYPYTYFDFKVYNSRRQFGNVVFSKYPLFNKHTIRYDSRSNITSCCDIKVNDDTIRLFINHLESNRIQNDIDTVMRKRSLQNSSLLDKLRSAGTIRLQQAQTVNDSVQVSPHPTIVVGDFNSIPLSRVYMKMCSGLNDTFLRSSNGRLGLTWHNRFFGLRIDYILCSSVFFPSDFRIDQAKGSDHYPCRVTLHW